MKLSGRKSSEEERITEKVTGVIMSGVLIPAWGE